MTVVVDPYLLAIPSGEGVTAEKIRQYATRLVRWDATFRTNPDYVVSSGTMREMRRLGLAPDGATLQTVFEKYGITEFSAYDIAEGCRTIVENYPRMEERPVEIVINCHKENQKNIPDEIRSRLHPKIAEAFSDALITKSYVLSVIDEDDIWSLATAPVSETYSEITVSGDVVDQNIEIFIEWKWPLVVNQSEFEALLSTQDQVLDIFQQNPLGALKISWEKIKRVDSTIPEYNSFNVKFMQQFVASVTARNIRQRTTYKKDIERIFDSIVNAFTNRWAFAGDKHHALRENIQSRTSPQQKRTRNGKVDLAGRIETIAGSNPLHVHYWRCYDGSYEISNVTDVHDDPTIYSDDPKKAR